MPISGALSFCMWAEYSIPGRCLPIKQSHPVNINEFQFEEKPDKNIMVQINYINQIPTNALIYY